MFGMVDSKVLPPKPVDLEQQEYKTFAFNCHSPHSIQYIYKEESSASTVVCIYAESLYTDLPGKTRQKLVCKTLKKSVK